MGCIEGIRSVDPESQITMIAGEGKPVYCRPLISYYLQGKTDFEKMKYRPDEFYTQNNCELIYGKAISVDTAARKAVLEDGRNIPYDSLCVATGSSPIVPAIEGLDTVDNRFVFMTEDDALALERTVSESSQVLIIGAGMIGLKCAEGLHGRVGSITVCDLAPRVLPSVLDDACASLIQKRMEENGISFLLGDSAARFEKNTAFLRSGREVSFDILVLAVGVRPNVSLVKDAGGECNKGICIDTQMKTSLDGVYAAGDCTEGYDCANGENRVLAIMPNAYMQGRCAGENMAGGSAVFDNSIIMNAIGFFGLHSLTAGSYDGEMYEKVTEESVKRLYFRDNRLVGFILIGDVAGAGIYTAMIRNKTPIDSVNIEFLEMMPSLAAFTAEYRGKILGEVI